ncbi:DUF222 domain-containing protein [Arthrobacter sp. 754]|uniref:HNH endonuclease signature motif containing protein n=1 Tax=Arthrobacter sp. 754 TaxID=3156315 RepID=UPI003397CF44
MGTSAVVVEALAAINAGYAVLASVVTETRAAPAAGTDSGSDSGADPAACLAEDCLEILAGLAGSEPRMAAVKALAAAKYAGTAALIAGPCTAPGDAAGQEMTVRAEIGCVLTIGDRAAGALLGQAQMLTTTLPLTLAALQAGIISWQHARVMIEEAATLDPQGAAGLEAHFLNPGPDAPDPAAPDPARTCTAGQMPAFRFRHKARTWRERHHTDSIEERHAKSVQDRRVEYTPDQDGMAWLSAHLPAHQTAAIWNRTTAIARGLQGPDESRTLTQLRADTFAAALLNTGTPFATGNQPGNGEEPCNGKDRSASGGGGAVNPGRVPTPRAQVLVTVPLLALLGATDEPAMLDGYGPIPASMARELVANGAESFYRVLVDPRDGAPLEIGRTSYRLTKAMKHALHLRDGKCTFPGCNNQSLDNDTDHLTAWQHGGATGISNLAQLCPKHHQLKHGSGWTPTAAAKNQPPGWTSPTGRHYKAEPHDWEPPHRPQQPEAQQKHGPSPGHPDFIHVGLSLGEGGIERFLHAAS